MSPGEVRRACVAVAVTAGMLLRPGEARAAVSVDGTTRFDSGRFTGSFTFDHAVPPGADRYLVVVVLDGNLGTAATAVSYGGAPLTLIGSSRGRDIASELWGLVAPPVGTRTVSVTLDSAKDRPIGVAVSLGGVDQAAPVGTPGTASGTTAAISVPVAAQAGDLVLDAAAAWSMRTAVMAAGGAGQTELWNVFNGVDTVVMGSDKLAAGATTMGWTVTGQQLSWAITAVPIRPAAATPMDAGAPDAGADTRSPDARTSPDAPPAVEAGPGMGPPDAPPAMDGSSAPPPPDAPTMIADAAPGRGARDAGGIDAAAREGVDGGAAPSADSGPAPARTLHLQVGSACAVAHRPPRAPLPLLLLAFPALRRRRPRRRAPGSRGHGETPRSAQG